MGYFILGIVTVLSIIGITFVVGLRNHMSKAKEMVKDIDNMPDRMKLALFSKQTNLESYKVMFANDDEGIQGYEIYSTNEMVEKIEKHLKTIHDALEGTDLGVTITKTSDEQLKDWLAESIKQDLQAHSDDK